MSDVQKIGLIAAAVLVAVVAFVLVSPAGDDTAESPTQSPSPRAGQPGEELTPATDDAAAPEARPSEAKPRQPPPGQTIRVSGGKPVGGLAAIDAKKGETVRFTISSSDTGDEVHVHGYALTEDLAPGASASFRFPAKLEGVFEIELEEAGTQIAELTVSP